MFKNPIGKYLSITRRAHTSLIDKKFQEKYNLSHGQVFILLNIYKNEGINQNDLCTDYKLDKSGVGRIIQKLEDKELIMRKSDPEDGRKKQIYLTDKANKMKKDFINLLKEIEFQMRKDLSEKEIEKFISILKKIYNNLEVGTDLQ